MSPSSHTPSSHTYPSSHRFFGLTKMWLLGDTTVFHILKYNFQYKIRNITRTSPKVQRSSRKCVKLVKIWVIYKFSAWTPYFGVWLLKNWLRLLVDTWNSVERGLVAHSWFTPIPAERKNLNFWLLDPGHSRYRNQTSRRSTISTFFFRHLHWWPPYILKPTLNNPKIYFRL